MEYYRAAWLECAADLIYDVRDVRQDAKQQAVRVAQEEAENGVKAAFQEKNVDELVQRVAREKVSAVTDKMIEQQLSSKLRPIEQRILLIGRISEAETRMRLGFRDGYDELTDILGGTPDREVLQFGKSTLEITGKHFETARLNTCS